VICPGRLSPVPRVRSSGSCPNRRSCSRSRSRPGAAASNFNWETHGSRLVPFWGDYIYILAEGGVAQTAWTDSRDLVPGSDPRETGASDDNDGFDVFTTCPASPAPAASDPCLSQGGLDQNIYTVRT